MVCQYHLNRISCSDGKSSAVASPPSKEQQSASEREKEMFALGRRDFNEAISYVETHYSKEQQLNAENLLLYTLCKEKLELIPKIPEFLPSEADPVHSGITAISTLQAVCSYWVGKDSAAIVRYAEDMPKGDLKTQMLCALAESLTAADQFGEAKRLLKDVPMYALPSSVAADIISNFRGKDPDDLFIWSFNIGGSEGKLFSIFSALTRKYENDIPNLQKLAARTAYPWKGYMLDELGQAVGKVEGEKTVEWMKASKMTPQEEIDFSIGALKKVPGSVLDNILDLVLTSKDITKRTTGMQRYLDRLLFIDRSHAIEWALTSPLDLRSMAIRWIVVRWFQENAVSSLEWIDTLAPGEDRDIALVVYVEQMQKVDPKAAKVIATDIGEPVLREKTLRAIEKP